MVRRTDPDRRDRILDAALLVIGEGGVAGTSHRRVAARADVPLGSMTYHFDGMDALLAEAFTRFADRMADRFTEALGGVADRAALADAVVALVHDDLAASPGDLVLTLELYTLAARQPAFRRITQAWMRRSRAALERTVDPATAHELDALIEGLFLHVALDPAPHDRATSRRAVGRVLGV